MKLLGATGSHVGNVRETNQDRVFFRSPVAVLADGMGGHQGGERAAELAVERFELAATIEPGDRVSLTEADLVELVLQANRRVHGHANDNGLAGMGTTVVALTLHEDDTITVANVGDSRAYWLRDDLMGQITEDHSFVEDLVRQGRLTPQEAAIHPQRNILTRAIGIGAEVEVDSFPIPEPELGDRFLLCSDGLFNELPESEILEILLDAEHPSDAAMALIESTLRTPCRDNVTVAVIEVVADDDPRLDVEVEAQITVETDGHDVQASVVTAPVPLVSNANLAGPLGVAGSEDLASAKAPDDGASGQASSGADSSEGAGGELGDISSFDDTLVVSSMNGEGGLATLLASEGLAQSEEKLDLDSSDPTASAESGNAAPDVRLDDAVTSPESGGPSANDEAPPSVEPRSGLTMVVAGLAAALVVLVGGYFAIRSVALSGSHVTANEQGGVTVFEGRRGGLLFVDPEPVAEHDLVVSALDDSEQDLLTDSFDSVEAAEGRITEIMERIAADEALAAAAAEQGSDQGEAEAGGTIGAQSGDDDSTNESTDLQGGSSSDPEG